MNWKPPQATSAPPPRGRPRKNLGLPSPGELLAESGCRASESSPSRLGNRSYPERVRSKGCASSPRVPRDGGSAVDADWLVTPRIRCRSDGRARSCRCCPARGALPFPASCPRPRRRAAPDRARRVCSLHAPRLGIVLGAGGVSLQALPREVRRSSSGGEHVPSEGKRKVTPCHARGHSLIASWMSLPAPAYRNGSCPRPSRHGRLPRELWTSKCDASAAHSSERETRTSRSPEIPR